MAPAAVIAAVVGSVYTIGKGLSAKSGMKRAEREARSKTVEGFKMPELPEFDFNLPEMPEPLPPPPPIGMSATLRSFRGVADKKGKSSTILTGGKGATGDSKKRFITGVSSKATQTLGSSSGASTVPKTLLGG